MDFIFKILRGEFFKNLLVMVSGTGLAAIVPLLAAPFLSRIYSPDQIGLLGIFLAATNILLPLLTLKYEQALVLESKKLQKAVFSFLLIFPLLCSILLFTALIVLSVQNIHLELSYLELCALIFNLVFMAWLQASQMLGLSRKDFNNLARVKVVQAVVTNLLMIITAFFFEPNSLLLCLSVAVGSFISVIYLWHKKHIHQFFYNRPLCVYALKKHIDFPKYATSSSLIQNLSVHSPVLIMSFAFNSALLGFYYLGYRVAFAPASLASVALSQIYYKRVSDNMGNKESIALLTGKLFNVLSLIALAYGAILIYFGDFIFGMLFGADWSEVGKVIAIMVPWLVGVFVISPFSNLFNVFQKQKTFFKLNVGAMILRVSALLFGCFWYKDFYLTLALFSIVSCLYWCSVMFSISKIISINGFYYVFRFLISLALIYTPYLVIY